METLKITYLGDIMFDYEFSKLKSSYINTQTGKFDFSDCFSELSDFLCGSNYVLGNLETPIALDNQNLTEELYSFCAPYEFLEAIKNSGVNYLSTANNHCLDRGVKGLVSTIECLDKLGFDHSGTYKSNKDKKPFILNKNGIKIGVLAYTYGTNAFSNNVYLKKSQKNMVDLLQHQEGYISKFNPFYYFVKNKPNGKIAYFYHKLSNKLHPENIGKLKHEKVYYSRYRIARLNREIKFLKQKADIVIAFIHVGEQYKENPSYFTKKITKMLKDKGVDIIIANHEHVVHGSEYQNGQFISYAIGNCFSTTSVLRPPYDKMSNYSVAVHTYLNKETKKLDRVTFSILKSFINKQGKLQVACLADYIDKLNEMEKKQEIKNALTVAKIFSGKEYDKIQKEFSLVEGVL